MTATLIALIAAAWIVLNAIVLLAACMYSARLTGANFSEKRSSRKRAP